MRPRLRLYLVLIIVALTVGAFIGYGIRAFQVIPVSPYVEQQTSPVRGLSAQEVDDLLNGRGAGFARSAELNSYPGPRHLLDLGDKMSLSTTQTAALEQIFEEMQTEAQTLGTQIVEAERLLSSSFANRAISDETLAEQIRDLADLYGHLRAIHLIAHLQSRTLLTDEQVTHYNELRGYDQTATNDSEAHHGNH